jgi:hypothetical protein
MPLEVPNVDAFVCRLRSHDGSGVAGLAYVSIDDPHSVQRLSIFETTLQARAGFLNF